MRMFDEKINLNNFFLGSSSMNTKTKGFLIPVIIVLLGVVSLNYLLSSDESFFNSFYSVTEKRTTNRKQATSSNGGSISRNANTLMILWYNLPSYLKTFVQDFKRQKCQNVRMKLYDINK